MLLLEQVVSLGGDPFVGNAALVSFATSPVGMVSFAVAGIGLILVNVLALGGQSLILWDARLGTSVSQLRIWYLLISRLPSLLAISVMVLGLALLLMAPVAAIAISARYLWLSSGDFYFYISTRPPGVYRCSPGDCNRSLDFRAVRALCSAQGRPCPASLLARPQGGFIGITFGDACDERARVGAAARTAPYHSSLDAFMDRRIDRSLPPA